MGLDFWRKQADYPDAAINKYSVALDLWRDYYNACEAFDWRVCTGPMGRDGIMPANSRELGMVGKYAQEQMAIVRRLAAESDICAQPIVRGLLGLGDIVGLKDDEALLRLIRRAVDPIPTWYDGGTICGYVPAVEDWCEANREVAVVGSGEEIENA